MILTHDDGSQFVFLYQDTEDNPVEMRKVGTVQLTFTEHKTEGRSPLRVEVCLFHREAMALRDFLNTLNLEEGGSLGGGVAAAAPSDQGEGS